LSYRVRFVLVDDTAGYDGEVAGLEAFADVTVITPPFNLGHQRALVYGLRTIAGDLDDVDIVVTMDADGEDRPEDLPRLIAPLLHHPDQLGMLCVARRTKRSESLRFKIFYLFFKLMFRSLTGNNVRSGNYAAYRGWLARRMLAHPYFDLCYSATLVSLDLSVTAVPCARGTRYAGSSRMNMLRLFMHGARAGSLHDHIRVGRRDGMRGVRFASVLQSGDSWMDDIHATGDTDPVHRCSG
jgi:hypothetical protein